MSPRHHVMIIVGAGEVVLPPELILSVLGRLAGFLLRATCPTIGR